MLQDYTWPGCRTRWAGRKVLLLWDNAPWHVSRAEHEAWAVAEPALDLLHDRIGPPAVGTLVVAVLDQGDRRRGPPLARSGTSPGGSMRGPAMTTSGWPTNAGPSSGSSKMASRHLGLPRMRRSSVNQVDSWRGAPQGATKPPRGFSSAPTRRRARGASCPSSR
jgi:hypothetical protein